LITDAAAVSHKMPSIVDLQKALVVEWAKQPQNLDKVEQLLKTFDDAVVAGNDASLAKMSASEQELMRRELLRIVALCMACVQRTCWKLRH
jgi:hypothetical protein